MAIIALSLSIIKFPKKNNTGSSRPSLENKSSTRFLIRAGIILLYVGFGAQILLFPAIRQHLQTFHSVIFGNNIPVLISVFIASTPIFLLLSTGFLNLYFKFTPSYRVSYLKKAIFFLVIFILIDIAFISYFYLNTISRFMLPQIIARESKTFYKALWPESFSTLLIPVFAFIVLFITNKRFRKMQSYKSIFFYKIFFLIFLIISTAYSLNLYLLYFADSIVQQDRLVVFGISYYFSGLFYLVIFWAAIMSFIYLTQIYHKQQYLLAKPLSGIYTLKLARINLLSSFALVLFLVLPWLLKQYFTFIK